MKPVRSFNTMLSRLRSRNRIRMAVVHPYDEATCAAVLRAVAEGLADAVLVGEVRRMALRYALSAYSPRVKILEVSDPDEAARTAVELVHWGEAGILVKGLINTDVLLRVLLDKTNGLLPRGRVMTHVLAAELPGWPRLLFASDVAVIPNPTLDQRVAMLGYGVSVCRAFGIAVPRVALLHYTEHVSERVPLSLDYREIVRRAGEGEWGDIVVDGPLDLRCALDGESARVKGIQSPLGGQADFLLMPDLEAGNLFYKILPFLCGARVAGILAGTRCPVVLGSRGDNAEDKFLGIAFALFTAGRLESDGERKAVKP